MVNSPPGIQTIPGGAIPGGVVGEADRYRVTAYETAKAASPAPSRASVRFIVSSRSRSPRSARCSFDPPGIIYAGGKMPGRD
jgi:hypothetical protein